MTEKIKINPLLIKALDHYASGSFNFQTPSFLVQRTKSNAEQAWTLEKTCALAAEVLANEKLAYLKLKTLEAGIKQYGMEGMYERIMGEKLP